MDGREGLLLWTLGGAGVLFLYAAYSKQHPGAVLAKTLGTPPPAPAPATGSSAVGPMPAAIQGGPQQVAPAFYSAPDPYAGLNTRIPGTVNV